MSDLEFEAYISLLGRFLRLGRAQREEIRRELQAHLEDALDEAGTRGESRADAIRRVLDDFGDAAELAARFSKLNRKRRWIMQGTLTAACLAFAAVTASFYFPASTPARANNQEAGFGAAGAALKPANGAASNAALESTDEAIYQALAKNVAQADFSETPLAEVIEWVHSTLGVNMHVQWNVLENAGIARDRTISLSLKNLTMERILRLVLDEIGGSDGVQLGFEAQDGILVVSTEEDLNRRTKFVVYDVRDILDALPPGGISTMAPEKAKVAREEPGQPAAVAGSGGELMQLITSSVRPESWEDNGGTGGIRWYHGLLVIRTNDAAHREVRGLLQSLRAALVETAKASGAAAR